MPRFSVYPFLRSYLVYTGCGEIVRVVMIHVFLIYEMFLLTP